MNSNASQARNDFVDYLRGLLVFLVAYGHTIQYVAYHNNAAIFYDDPIFKLIYIFHMPLFMAVSGFVSFYSITRNSTFETIAKRFRQLIIPIVSWAVISRSILFFTQTHLRHTKSFDLLLLLAKAIVRGTLESFWFLWCVFGATLMVLILRKLKADSFSGLILACFAMLCLPEFSNFYLFKYMLPFFCAGYLLSKNNSFHSQKVSFFKLTLGLLISLICFLLWHKGTYIYLSKMGFTHDNYVNIILRYFSGFMLSITFIMLAFSLFSRTGRHPFICALGKSSLAIYILQTYAFFIIERTNTTLEIPLSALLFLSPLIAVLICVIAYYLAKWLYQYPLPSNLLLGSWIKAKT